VRPLLYAHTGQHSPIKITPHKAAVVRDDRTVPAVGALIEMPAQGGSATAHDGSQHFEVLPGDPPAAAFDEAASRGANQIGHLERWPVHLFALVYLLFQLERVPRCFEGILVVAHKCAICILLHLEVQPD
jgi:hypothetical protein